MRASRIRDIIEMQFAPIRDEVERLVGADLGRLAEMPTGEEIKTWTDAIATAARTSAGLAYATYIRR